MVKKTNWMAWVAVIALIVAVVAIVVAVKANSTEPSLSPGFWKRFAAYQNNISNNQSDQNNTWTNQSVGIINETAYNMSIGVGFKLHYYINATNSTSPRNSTYVCYNGTIFASYTPCR